MNVETEESRENYRQMAKDCLALKVMDGSSTKPLLLKRLELSFAKKTRQGRNGSRALHAMKPGGLIAA
ncbi:MAG: hypothetical protein OSA98_21670 [Rubripirellula sp.]|nr:hypothetical protein [Rubripirellula sp.]